jgi:conjugative transfer signal peptidase TraF
MLKQKYPIYILFSLVVIFIVIRFFEITINYTRSMPLGIYIKRSGEIGRCDIISFCLPDKYKKMGLNNHYIEYGTACDGSEGLIKKVIAIPGDTVLLKEDSVIVNKQIYKYKTKKIDSSGRKLLNYARGKYKNIEGYFVIGEGAENSWDSRYFGFIKTDRIVMKLKPFIIYNF